MAQTDVKLLKNTVLGSLNQIDDVDSIHKVSWEKLQTTKNEDTSTNTWEPQTQKLISVFPEQSSFQIHANDENWLSHYRMQIFHKMSETTQSHP